MQDPGATSETRLRPPLFVFKSHLVAVRHRPHLRSRQYQTIQTGRQQNRLLGLKAGLRSALSSSLRQPYEFDPKNVAVFCVDAHTVKAIGYGMISDRPAIWYAEGNLQDGHAKLAYRYSTDNTPNGWEPEGVMQLRLSEDGNTMSGRATSRSGAWSDRIEFKRTSPNSN
jgi:hypothetical protein